MDSKKDLQEELNSFQSIWEGGFYTGDPLDRSYGLLGLSSYTGLSHAIYLAHIKPYIKADTTVLEIGCGRGAWTKLMLKAKDIYCLDALSAEHNSFYNYVGKHDHIHYTKVEDFSMSSVPDNSIDYVFSYDALCHVSFEGVAEYSENMFKKMKSGATAFWMVADYEKNNKFIDELEKTNVLNFIIPRGPGKKVIANIIKAILNKMCSWNAKRFHLYKMMLNEDNSSIPGRWYHIGKDNLVAQLKSVGYEIISDDTGFDPRSPIVHFKKP